MAAFSVGQRVRVVRATGRDDIVERDVGWVFGSTGRHLRVLFSPGMILPVEPWRVRIVAVEADRLG